MRHSYRHSRWFVFLALALTGACSTAVVQHSAPLNAGMLPALRGGQSEQVKPAENTPPAPPPPSVDIAHVYPHATLLTVPDSRRKRLHHEISPISGTRRRADSLLQFLFGPSGIGLSYQYDANLSPAEVYARGVGNCISLSMLVVAAAREVGLNASFQEVRTDLNWHRAGSVFFMDRHINVRIRGVSGRQDYVVDLRPTPAELKQPVQALSDREALGHFYNNLAARALSTNADHQALAWFRRALASAPQLGFIWANLGTLYLRHEQYQDAALTLEHALALAPREYLAISNLSHAYRRLGRNEAAARLDERAREIRLRNPFYRALLAEQALEAGQLDRATEHIKSALRSAAEDPALQLLAGRIHLAGGKTELAREALLRARRHQPRMNEHDHSIMQDLALQLDHP